MADEFDEVVEGGGEEGEEDEEDGDDDDEFEEGEGAAHLGPRRRCFSRRMGWGGNFFRNSGGCDRLRCGQLIAGAAV